MWYIMLKISYFLFSVKRQLKSLFLRLGCYFISTWSYIDNVSICTTGKVLKLNGLYTYKEGSHVTTVKLNNIHIEKGFLYCSLLFFSKDKVITVSSTMQKHQYIIWRLFDYEELGVIMSRRATRNVFGQDDLLEFDF